MGLPTTVQFDVTDSLDIDGTSTTTATKDASFEMDAVFPPHIEQRTVFEIIGQQHVQSVIDGFNSTVFAYGRTGSGKTHTMVGPASQRYGNSWTFAELEAESADPEGQPSELGLVPRCLHSLLAKIREQSATRHFTVRFACAEIYNQKLFDLCALGVDGVSGERAEIANGRMTTSATDKISWHDIQLQLGAEDEAMTRAQQLICRANAARAHAATAANVDSSRSHVLYLARVSSVGQEGDCREAMLAIVDLAGSESLDPQRDKSATASRDNETRAINSSLHTLTRVVNAYATAPAGGRPAHVPYRESLLTLLLKDSIGGNCMTSIIVAISADEEQLVHSYKSCQFARLARGVRNVVRENKHYDPGNVIASLRSKVAELQEALSLRDAAACAESAAGPRLGALLAMLPAPDYPWERAVDVVSQWLDSASAGGDENSQLAEEDTTSMQDTYEERVHALAALVKALEEVVKRTGVPGTLCEPAEREDTGVGTSPWMARGHQQDIGLGAAVPGASPTLLRRQDMSGALDPTAVAAVIRGRVLEETRAWLAKAHEKVIPMLQCAAAVLETRMASRAAGTAPGLPPALGRLTLGPAAEEDPVLIAQREYCSITLRIEALRAEVAAAQARVVQLSSEERSGGPEASTVSSTHPLLLPASASGAARGTGTGTAAAPCASPTPHVAEWQEQVNGQWVTVEEALNQQLQTLASCPPGTTLLVTPPVGPTPSLSPCTFTLLAAGQAPTVPSLPHYREEKGALQVVACAQELEELQECDFLGAAVQPFIGPLLYSLLPPAGPGQPPGSAAVATAQCVATGARRTLRRHVLMVLEGDLLKKSKWSGQWVSRTFRLLPTALAQLFDAEGRARARELIRQKHGGAAPSDRRAALAAASIDKVKARFSPDGASSPHPVCAVSAEVVPEGHPGGEEGREFTVKGAGSGKPMSFRAGSRLEAETWVAAINAAASGAYWTASTVPAEAREEPSTPSAPSALSSVLATVVSARIKEAQTRATRLSFDADALAALSTPLVPPMASPKGMALLVKELSMPWASGWGESPCGLPVLLPVSRESTEWLGNVEPLQGAVGGEGGGEASDWTEAIRLLEGGSGGGAAEGGALSVRCEVRRALRVQNALLAQRFLGLCAEARYRQGRKAVGTGYACSSLPSQAALMHALSTGACSSPHSLHTGLAAAVVDMCTGLAASLSGAGCAHMGMRLHTSGRALLPVLVYRVAYSTSGGTAKGSGLPFSPPPVRNMSAAGGLLARTPSAATTGAPAPALVPVPPRVALGGSSSTTADSVASALASPASIVCLYPAYLLLTKVQWTR